MRTTLPGLLLAILLLPTARLLAQEERVNLGSGINSGYSELQPVVTADEQILFFTRKGDSLNVGFSTRPDDEDIWYAERQADGSWSDAKHLPGALNTTGHDGVRAVNSTVTRLYLQNRYLPGGGRSKGYSVSERAPDGSWGFPVPLDIENYYNDTSVASMSVSKDENVLILSAKRKDSRGGNDLYVSFRVGAYRYSEPRSIDALNTTGDEIAPCIGFDDHTIYFPSSGWKAEEGRSDIFISRRLDSSWLNWSSPERLPVPINTPSADFYFDLSAEGDSCFLSSWHETSSRGFGKSDIWKVYMPERYRPGSFGRDTAKPPGIGTLIRLENVYFDVAKASLRPESQEALNKLVVLLGNFPTLRIELQGHTDSDASEEYNHTLSHDRVLAVRDYLITNSIAAERLKTQGFGESMPIAPNTTEAGKQLNRRVMVRILDYDYR